MTSGQWSAAATAVVAVVAGIAVTAKLRHTVAGPFLGVCTFATVIVLAAVTGVLPL